MDSNHQPIWCAIFDYDGTLIESSRATMIRLQKIAQREGYYVPSLLQLRQIWHLPWEEILWNYWVAHAGHMADLFDAKRNSLQFAVEPNAVKILRHFARKKVVLILVSNHDHKSLLNSAHNAVLPLELFTHIDCVDGRSHHKPDHRVFKRAWKQVQALGITKAETISIGDSIGDLAASQNFGLRFIAYPSYVTSATDFRKKGVPKEDLVHDLIELKRFI